MAYSYVEFQVGDRCKAIDYKKFGINEAVPTSFREIWTGGENFQGWDSLPTVPVAFSESALDIGVAITVEGLDEDDYLQTETVILSGATPVSFTKLFKGIFRASVSNGLKELDGNVLIYNAEQTILKTHIPNSGNNQTLTLFWTVPKGFFMLCKGFRFTLGQGKEMEVKQQIRNSGGVWRTQDYLYMYENLLDFPCKVMNRVEELADVRFLAKAGLAGTPIAGVAEFTLIEYEPNSSINPKYL